MATYFEQCRERRSDYKIDELPAPAANAVRIVGSWTATEGSLAGKKRTTAMELRRSADVEAKTAAAEQVSRAALRLMDAEAES